MKDIVNKLPKIDVDPDKISSYLNTSYSIFYAMPPEDLFEIVWELKQYALYLKIEYNITYARSRWLYNSIMKVAKVRATQHASYDKDERLQSAIKEDQNLKDLQDKRIENDSAADILNQVDRSVSYLIDTLEKMAFYKLERGKNESTGKN